MQVKKNNAHKATRHKETAIDYCSGSRLCYVPLRDLLVHIKSPGAEFIFKSKDACNINYNENMH